MPFIKQSRRTNLDQVYNAMIAAGIKADGDLNYILYKFCKYQIHPSYNNYKNFLGELQECIEQCRRDLLSPYERLMEKENGYV